MNFCSFSVLFQENLLNQTLDQHKKYAEQLDQHEQICGCITKYHAEKINLYFVFKSEKTWTPFEVLIK